MAGGIGGFYLASSLGLSKEATGSYQPGFLIFAGLALIALGGLSAIKKRWRMTWGAAVQGVRICWAFNLKYRAVTPWLQEESTPANTWSWSAPAWLAAARRRKC